MKRRSTSSLSAKAKILKPWSGPNPSPSNRPSSWPATTDRRGGPAISDLVQGFRGRGSATEPTYRVSELGEEIRDFLTQAYALVWVVGEVQRARQSQRGHLYFELVEKGEGDQVVGKLDAVVWRGDLLRVRRALAATRQEIVEGVEIRCRASVDFYPPGGRLQLVVKEVDPLFSLGLLEKRRRETLAALEAAGLLDRNRALELPAVPLRLGLVSSEGSAAYHDFLSGLEESGYGFEVFFAHASMQGKAAEAEVTAALHALGQRSLGRLELDAIALVRGGGSRTDLAAFDSRSIAEAIARCPLPVLTGLGHEIDESIADRVAHSAFKTPTKVAEFFVDRVVRSEEAAEALREAIARLAVERLRRSREALRRLERVASSAHLRLEAAAHRLEDLARSLDLLGRRRLREAERRRLELELRLAAAGPRQIERARREPLLLAERLVGVATGKLREAGAMLLGIERLCRSLAPERTLERGFSITRNQAGVLVRRPDQAPLGERITTQIAGGVLTSRVEEEP